jgi:putative oxygen-independent coproporphyrinogen III oxidase
MDYNTAMQVSLYVHFPFCLRKCLYCDFNSLAGSPVMADEYAGAVLKEMDLCAGRLSAPVAAPTLYFGGGTPSLMAPRDVGGIVAAAVRLYNLADDAEITLEANPGTLTAKNLAGYRTAGVNRLSLGVQSFNDTFLRQLGRIHTARQAQDAFDLARRAGFANIGIDLIHTLPGESPAAWRDDLGRAIALGPEHISAYGLSVEEGTPFQELARKGELHLPDEEAGLTMFRETAEFLQEEGYEHYEISNFALPGCRSRHNQVYWRRRNYLGIGAGAHSFLRAPGFGTRWGNSPGPPDYMQSLDREMLPREELTHLTEREAMAEFFFLGLRMLEGVEPARFRREFAVDLDDAYPGVVSGLLAEGLLECRRNRLRLTGTGLVLANQVFLKFV